jgi:hypothetical protein
MVKTEPKRESARNLAKIDYEKLVYCNSQHERKCGGIVSGLGILPSPLVLRVDATTRYTYSNE